MIKYSTIAMRLKYITTLLILIFSNYGCQQENPGPKGCTSRQALNFDEEARQDDGSCQYSRAVFYARYNSANNVRIGKIVVFTDGIKLGEITKFYENGIDGCFVSGTVPYEFSDEKSITWTTHIYDTKGVKSRFEDFGTISPSRTKECVQINVTNN